jgi:hypothetical protein
VSVSVSVLGRVLVEVAGEGQVVVVAAAAEAEEAEAEEEEEAEEEAEAEEAAEEAAVEAAVRVVAVAVEWPEEEQVPALRPVWGRRCVSACSRPVARLLGGVALVQGKPVPSLLRKSASGPQAPRWPEMATGRRSVWSSQRAEPLGLGLPAARLARVWAAQQRQSARAQSGPQRRLPPAR